MISYASVSMGHISNYYYFDSTVDD